MNEKPSTIVIFLVACSLIVGFLIVEIPAKFPSSETYTMSGYVVSEPQNYGTQEMTIAFMRDDNNKLENIVIQNRDSRFFKGLHALIRYQVIHDSFSGDPNTFVILSVEQINRESSMVKR